ncbi:hypothetical protein [Peribacillus sp. SCS-155]|uniref:hypothetical protein n=1 Tax=Peribacillus sedimenti TaxID=3115297 RepID=UPI00390685FA
MNIDQKSELFKLKNYGTNLKQLVEENGTCEEQIQQVSSIKHCLSTIHNLDKTNDVQTKSLRMVENRLNRSERLLILGSSKMIIEHEVKWLNIMIEHIEQILNGLEPVFTEAQKAELEWEKLSQGD